MSAIQGQRQADVLQGKSQGQVKIQGQDVSQSKSQGQGQVKAQGQSKMQKQAQTRLPVRPTRLPPLNLNQAPSLPLQGKVQVRGQANVIRQSKVQIQGQGNVLRQTNVQDRPQIQRNVSSQDHVPFKRGLRKCSSVGSGGQGIILQCFDLETLSRYVGASNLGMYGMKLTEPYDLVPLPRVLPDNCVIKKAMCENVEDYADAKLAVTKEVRNNKSVVIKCITYANQQGLNVMEFITRYTPFHVINHRTHGPTLVLCIVHMYEDVKENVYYPVFREAICDATIFKGTHEREKLTVRMLVDLIQSVLMLLIAMQSQTFKASDRRLHHVDIKPANILIYSGVGKYNCVLADFGSITWAGSPESEESVMTTFKSPFIHKLLLHKVSDDQKNVQQAWEHEFPHSDPSNTSSPILRMNFAWIKHDLFGLGKVVDILLSFIARGYLTDGNLEVDPHYKSMETALRSAVEDMTHVKKYVKTDGGVSREVAKNPIMTLEDAMTRWKQIEHTLEIQSWELERAPLQGQVQEFSSGGGRKRSTVNTCKRTSR